MRQVATLAAAVNDVVRLMVCEDGTGVLLFLYTSEADGPCRFDEFHVDVASARESARRQFGVPASAWVSIADPPPGCQQDWIRPTRVERDEAGNMSAGQFDVARK